MISLEYYLECDHCGGPAIYSATGLFAEGDAICVSCGKPGRVSVDEEDEDGEPLASWRQGDGCCWLDDCDDPACDPDEPPSEAR